MAAPCVIASSRIDTPMLRGCMPDGPECAMMMHVTTVRDQMATQTDEQADNLADEQLAARYGKHVRTVMRWRRLRAGPPRFRDPGGLSGTGSPPRGGGGRGQRTAPRHRRP